MPEHDPKIERSLSLRDMPGVLGDTVAKLRSVATDEDAATLTKTWVDYIKRLAIQSRDMTQMERNMQAQQYIKELHDELDPKSGSHDPNGVLTVALFCLPTAQLDRIIKSFTPPGALQ